MRDSEAGSGREGGYPSSVPGDRDPGLPASGSSENAKDVQPGTGRKGKNWQSRRPDPASPNEKLDTALEDSFPASDPPAPAQPSITGWDKKDVDEAAKKP